MEIREQTWLCLPELQLGTIGGGAHSECGIVAVLTWDLPTAAGELGQLRPAGISQW